MIRSTTSSRWVKNVREDTTTVKLVTNGRIFLALDHLIENGESHREEVTDTQFTSECLAKMETFGFVTWRFIGNKKYYTITPTGEEAHRIMLNKMTPKGSEKFEEALGVPKALSKRYVKVPVIINKERLEHFRNVKW